MNTVRWFFKKIVDGQEVEITSNLSVGRLEGSGLQLKERSASSRHAELALTDGALFVTDLGSTNGTFVNGTQLPPKTRTKLNSGDRIRFDVEEFETRMVSPPEKTDDNRTVLRESPPEYAKTILSARPAAAAEKPAAAAPVPPPAAAARPAPRAEPAAPAGASPGGWDDKGAGTVLIDAPIRTGGAVAADEGASNDIPVPFLYVVSGKREKQRIRLVSEETGKSAWTIGSRADQTIQFDDDGVSAEHAKLSTDGQRWVLTDRITTNGTYVNGKRVPMAWLSAGDRLQFGPVECVFHVPRSIRAAVAAGSGAGWRRRTPMLIAVAASFIVTLVVIYFVFRRH
jgi:pSer/pThr/pTyr-binding forkhead associated (FHA) protein